MKTMAESTLANRLQERQATHAPVTRVYDFTWSRRRHGRVYHESPGQEPSAWAANQWHTLATSYAPKEGVVRFNSEKPLNALSAYDQLLREWYQEERISVLARQNRFLTRRVAELESRYEALESAINSAGIAGSSLPAGVEESPATVVEPLPPELVVSSARESAAALKWNVSFEYRADEQQLEVLVPRNCTGHIANSTLEFYAEMEQRLGVERFSRLQMDFGISDEQ
jgi:hypothetical protein